MFYLIADSINVPWQFTNKSFHMQFKSTNMLQRGCPFSILGWITSDQNIQSVASEHWCEYGWTARYSQMAFCFDRIIKGHSQSGPSHHVSMDAEWRWLRVKDQSHVFWKIFNQIQCMVLWKTNGLEKELQGSTAAELPLLLGLFLGRYNLLLCFAVTRCYRV